MNGYVKIHRELCTHSIWLAEKFTRGQAWVDLILLANAQKGFVIKRGIEIPLERGELGWAMETLSKRWQWSRDKVRKFLKLLDKHGMIKLEITKVSCTINIKNYDHWQSDKWQLKRINKTYDSNTTNEQESNVKPTSNQHQTNVKRYTNNNDNEKKDNMKKRVLNTLTSEDLKKLKIKYPSMDIKDSYYKFVKYYTSMGKKFVDELAAVEFWILNDKNFDKEYESRIKYYRYICPKCKDKSTQPIIKGRYSFKRCDNCGAIKNRRSLTEEELNTFIQRQNSRISDTDKGA